METAREFDPRRTETGAAVRPAAGVGEVTRRVPTEKLERGGITTVRLLDEARFIEALGQAVEERVRRRLASLGEAITGEDRSVREEYLAKWDDFRARYEEKLGRIEEMIRARGK